MTDNEYVNKQTILDAIKSTKPEPSEYMDMTDNIVVNTIILGAAVKQYEDIVKIVEATQPTECKPVVRGEWQDDDINCNVIGVSPVKCSVCGKINAITIWTQFYCGYCGARMKELESEEEE